MSIINLFLQKRRMRESQHGIIMVTAAYVLSIFMLVMGSDVFYNINSEAAGINRTTDEETQGKINKKMPVLPAEETSVLLMQSNLQKPFGIAEANGTGLGRFGTAEAYGGRTAALTSREAQTLQTENTTAQTVSVGSVSNVITDELATELAANEELYKNGTIAPLAAYAQATPADNKEKSKEKKKDKEKEKDDIYSLSTEEEKSFVYDVTSSEISMLERIVQAEAGGEDMKGKILIANVILNRVADDQFPDDIESVIFQNKNGEYQFSPVDDERYWKVKVSEKTKQAVQRALEGEDYSKGALYFIARKRTSAGSAAWFDNNLEWLFKHGGHEFYK